MGGAVDVVVSHPTGGSPLIVDASVCVGVDAVLSHPPVVSLVVVDASVCVGVDVVLARYLSLGSPAIGVACMVVVLPSSVSVVASHPTAGAH
jgi:hypothetical protein